MKIDIRETLQFFDEKPPDSHHHATAIAGILGEDLGVALFRHYIEVTARAGYVKIYAKTPTTGHRKGPRLDKWIEVHWDNKPAELFQTEIKSWSAHAIGGKRLPVSASADYMSKHKIDRWDAVWDREKCLPRLDQVSKVLCPMARPSDADPKVRIVPLLIFWNALHPTGATDYYFPVDVARGKSFRKLWVFSQSAYLRQLPDACIDIEMLDAACRVQWLHRLLPDC